MLTFRSLHQVLTPKRLAILEAVVIGLVAAVAAVLLKQGVVLLGGWRVQMTSYLPTWLWLPIVGLVGGLLTGFLVERVAPEASGSGIPQIKAALAYFPIVLNLRVGLTKLIATLIALSSGFTLGQEGPTLQIGAALAAQFSRWVPASPTHQRQLIASGAAAGLAAAFDAPIAGVMFVIEELLQDVSSLTLGTAIVASFIGGVVSRVLGGPGVKLGASLHEVNFSLPEIPAFLLLGVLTGVIAAVFHRGVLWGQSYVHRKLPLRLPLKIGLAGLITGVTAAFLQPQFWQSATLEEFLTAGEASWQMTLVALLVQFSLTLVASSMETPGGLFVPSLVLGATIGHLVGLANHWLWGGEPTTYALAGMGAFCGAVAKVPVTAIVIVFEITTSFDLVLPLMISAVTAYLVAERYAPGSLYTNLLALKGIHIEAEADKDGLWSRLTAADVMETRVEALRSEFTIEDAIQAFSRSHHRGFPVVNDTDKLVGIVTLSDLDKVTQRQLPKDAPLKEIMTSSPISVTPSDPLSQVLYLLSRYKLSRLPVIDRRKLVGIITRSDILRVEAEKLRAEPDRVGPKAEPSFVVYQTRSPEIGRGRLLLPLSNPQTASALLKMALAIAQERNYEIECLQVVLAPRHSSPSEAAVNTTISRRLLNQAVRQAQLWKVPIHTQIRVTHSLSQAILETVKDRRINTLLMGWKGSTITPGRIFGDVVDSVIRQAPCNVVLVKFGDGIAPAQEEPSPAIHALMRLMRLKRWLIPVAGGPNSQYAIELLPALASLTQQPEVLLCQVHSPADPNFDHRPLTDKAAILRQRLSGTVSTLPVCSPSVSEAVIDLAENEQCDVIVVGASREGMLQQVIHGNIPEAIARNCNCTVILVRRAIE